MFFELENYFLNSNFFHKYVNFTPLTMAVPTNITEPPMAHIKQKSLHRSKGKKHSFPVELYLHVFEDIMCITADDQLEFLYNWISYRGFLNFDDLHEQYCHNPDSINQDLDYKINGMYKTVTSNMGCRKQLPPTSSRSLHNSLIG